MATTPATQTTPPAAAELWTGIKKEITGIQLLWETVNGLYFQLQGKEWQALAADVPLLAHLTQTAMMESLLMRLSRLMDPAATGKLTNLSLKQLAAAEPKLDADEKAIRAIWDGSGLVDVRNKYLSHNDLNRSMAVDHTLNIPITSADIDALRQLAEGFRALRREVSLKLDGVAYVDQGLDAAVLHEIETLGKTLLGCNLFFKLLPEHEFLQQALTSQEDIE
nr:hypothetical protein [Rhodoferax sp.]